MVEVQASEIVVEDAGEFLKSTTCHKKYKHYLGSFENSVGNAAQRACALNAVKLSFPAMRNKTVRMVSKRAYPRALRFAA
ncbi:hypothetical protein SBC1_02630 [Caballeronia sp. SBC1]|nr:hypothetical protein SBC1_02630 [Caballeronia sp. SBC1]